MSDNDLQRVTESLSYIGQAPNRQNPSLLQAINRSSAKLTPKEEAFCLAIVEGLSQSDAYRKAYSPRRATLKTIHEKASRIMARGKARARVAELMRPVLAQAQMSRKEWLERLTQCCRFDPRKMFDAQGRPKKLTELDDNEAAAIAVFEVSETVHGQDHAAKLKRTFRLRLLDRLGAFTLLGKACGYYADRRETEADGKREGITVQFVNASISPDEYPGGFWQQYMPRYRPSLL